MTNEDAIRWLDNLKNDIGNPHYERLWHYEQAIAEIMELLKEQKEKPLRCDKCSYHREDGWCGMHGRWVTETDYCSLGAWKCW